MDPQWKKQESRLHRQGARRVSGSGAGYRKGDNRGKNFLVQCKATEKISFHLTFGDLNKMIGDAATEELIPVMQLELGEESNAYAILREKDWAALDQEACTNFSTYKTREVKGLQVTLHLVDLQRECRSILCVAFGPARVVVLDWYAFLYALEEAEFPL